MFAKTQCDYVYGLRSAEKRSAPRKAVTLPMSMMARGVRHNAVLRNLSAQGAMIQTATSLSDFDQISFQCGSVTVDATIMWRNEGGVGIRFAQPISARQLDEQVARSAAVENWRERRNGIKEDLLRHFNGQSRLSANYPIVDIRDTMPTAAKSPYVAARAVQHVRSAGLQQNFVFRH